LFCQFLVIKTLDPDQDSLEMLDPDPDSGSTRTLSTFLMQWSYASSSMAKYQSSDRVRAFNLQIPKVKNARF
jgi:hypothetical protein